MEIKNTNTGIQFLSGGGEMGELIRAKDWTLTPIGSPEFWSQSLRITLSIMLNSKFPMFLWWGPELICFYNDAYRPSLGKEGKHPSILGMKAEEAWTEIWDIIKPLIDQAVEKGESTWFEDLLVPIYRNGAIEDVYWTFSYSPVYEEWDKVTGVLVTCTETTEKVFMKRQLEESEHKLRLIILQAPVSIGIFRGQEYVTEIINPRALELAGKKEEEVLHKPIFSVMPELRAQGIEKFVDEVYKTGKRFSVTEFPLQLLKNDQLQTLYINFSCDPLYDSSGKIEGIMLVGADVTEQVLSHKKIESNEEKLNIVIDASDLGTWELNVKTNEATYSKRYLEILGYEEDAKPTHAQLLMHLHPEDLPVRAKAFKEAFETGYLHYESRLVWDDNSIHWMEGRGKLFYDNEQKPWKMIGTIRDITDEKKNQQQLVESEQVFRNLVMQSPVPKAILRGPDHVVEMANTALLKTIWRKNESDVEGKKILDIFPELREQKYAALLDQVYYSGKKHTGTETSITLAGNDGIKTFYVDFEYAPLFEADNSVSGIKITAIDVTEKVLARKKIEESENELRILSSSLEKKVLERTRELEQKNDDLEKMNKELQSFAYISSHDLQEPLRKIQTFATRLIEKENDQLSKYAKDQFKKMQVSAERMQSLIDDLLAYSRTNTAERKFEKINLGKILEEVKEDLQEELKEKHAVVETTGMCDVNVVRFQFRQLMQNLISNSLKFSKPGQTPVIQISSWVNSGANLPNDQLAPNEIYCYIRVSDNGIGFEQQYSSKIFELFQRLHARTEFHGTGIGLAIVKKIVENHNGFITAKGELNKGALFEIYLPVD